ncbi:hypothetical protein QEH59_04190 [Coraliomargarita sp. SDUM461004]|uniref:PEP-CTERM sorting domain-containing protein n=1 Tax=Thalassobacterium sedimentorum TaxID=3041258 RepID=A0ABU1AG99_9BACT|nr:hypothetical protein [Coraliomargarita sp. SDUM461004]MDQ8193609.1 hypothetical protein [Coraliomargarita sp. SDUM461004]
MHLPLCLFTLLGATSLSAQVNFNSSYSQDFNTLAVNTSSTTSATFTNNETLIGWYSNKAGSARASSGSSSEWGNGIYSWGLENTTERALGTYINEGFAASPAYLGVQLLNTSGETINSISLSYTIEQWRRNTNATTWTADYLIASNSNDMISASSGYTNIPAATVTAEYTGTPGGASYLGTDANQAFTITLSDLNWENGEYLWIRWTNAQSVDSSGLAIDDLTITAIPEVNSTSLLIGCLALTSATLLHRRNQE